MRFAIVFRERRVNDKAYECSVILRSDTAFNWEFYNPVLSELEAAIDVTNNEVRIGNGETPWKWLAVATPEDALKLLLGARRA